MHLFDNGSQVPSLGAPQPAVGTPGFAATGAPGTFTETILDPDLANTIVQELAGVVTAASIALDRTNNAQLLAALLTLCGGNGSIGSTSGWMTLPGGLIVQFGGFAGTCSVGPGSTGIWETPPITVTFPITFPNRCIRVVVSAHDVAGSGLGESAWLGGAAGPASVVLALFCAQANAAMTGDFIALGV